MPSKPNRRNKSAAAEAGRSDRWRTSILEPEFLRYGWRAWMAEIARAHFSPDSRPTSIASVMTEGAAQGLAWLISDATLGRPRRRAKRAWGAATRFGPGHDVHSRLVASVAHSALSMGHDILAAELKDVQPTVAAQIVTAAAADAIEDVFAGPGDRGAVRQLFLIEIQERLDARVPWLTAAVGSGGPSLLDRLRGAD